MFKSNYQILISDEKEYKKGDILVFLSGQEDIEDLQELLNSRKEILKNKFPEKNIFFKVFHQCLIMSK